MFHTINKRHLQGKTDKVSALKHVVHSICQYSIDHSLPNTNEDQLIRSAYEKAILNLSEKNLIKAIQCCEEICSITRPNIDPDPVNVYNKYIELICGKISPTQKDFIQYRSLGLQLACVLLKKNASNEIEFDKISNLINEKNNLIIDAMLWQIQAYEGQHQLCIDGKQILFEADRFLYNSRKARMLKDFGGEMYATEMIEKLINHHPTYYGLGMGLQTLMHECTTDPRVGLGWYNIKNNDLDSVFPAEQRKQHVEDQYCYLFIKLLKNKQTQADDTQYLNELETLAKQGYLQASRSLSEIYRCSERPEDVQAARYFTQLAILQGDTYFAAYSATENKMLEIESQKRVFLKYFFVYSGAIFLDNYRRFAELHTEFFLSKEERQDLYDYNQYCLKRVLNFFNQLVIDKETNLSLEDITTEFSRLPDGPTFSKTMLHRREFSQQQLCAFDSIHQSYRINRIYALNLIHQITTLEQIYPNMLLELQTLFKLQDGFGIKDTLVIKQNLELNQQVAIRKIR